MLDPLLYWWSVPPVVHANKNCSGDGLFVNGNLHFFCISKIYDVCHAIRCYGLRVICIYCSWDRHCSWEIKDMSSQWQNPSKAVVMTGCHNDNLQGHQWQHTHHYYDPIVRHKCQYNCKLMQSQNEITTWLLVEKLKTVNQNEAPLESYFKCRFMHLPNEAENNSGIVIGWPVSPCGVFPVVMHVVQHMMPPPSAVRERSVIRHKKTLLTV